MDRNKTLKYYFEDVGLRNARLNFRQQEETRIMENILFNELIARGYQVDVGVVDTAENGSSSSTPLRMVRLKGNPDAHARGTHSIAGGRIDEGRISLNPNLT